MLCYINTWTQIFGADLTANRRHSSVSLLSCNYDTLFEKITMDSDLSSLMDLPLYYLNLFCTLMQYMSLFICLLIVPYSSRSWDYDHFSGHSLSPHHSTRKLPILSAPLVNRFT